jgi:hypothetical protein
MRQNPQRGLVALFTTCLLTALGLIITAPPAGAAVQQGIGHTVTPGQSYGGRHRTGDWVGSYLVGGKQVFCVQFEFKAPDTDEAYRPGEELLTKWGERLPEATAANISYLLLRYGATSNPDEAAALAHLLHSWTAAPRPGHDDLNPAKGFREVGYDAPFHLGKLPSAAQAAVDRLRRDAEANRGPWTATLTPPTGEQVIGTAAGWTLTVKNPHGAGVPRVPVTLKLTDATVDGKQTATVTTDDKGTATLQVTPAGENPKVAATLAAPADRPYAQSPVDADTQRVVSTGGEKQLSTQAAVKARTRPGTVRVAKTDAGTGAGISGVTLRLTGKDKATPALGQDGKPLTGMDGKPAVLTTGADGVGTVENLRTPQEICIVEVSAPDGYGQGFDPRNPPSACGEVEPGETLALEIKNVPDQVPHTIPAGGEPLVVLRGETTAAPATGALAGMGALAVIASGLVGLIARRRLTRR